MTALAKNHVVTPRQVENILDIMQNPQFTLLVSDVQWIMPVLFPSNNILLKLPMFHLHIV